MTKRHILSRIATIYDPLGLLSPIIVRAIIFMQQLWQLNIDWDTNISEELQDIWTNFINSLCYINELHIPRYINPSQSMFDIYGFCDASEKAYGACLYAVSKDDQGNYISNLICGKSRAAPIKAQTLTSNYIWQHVDGFDNPADVVSRGITAEELLNHDLWWFGPKWIRTGHWSKQAEKYETTEEHKVRKVVLPVLQTLSILTRYSRFDKLKRVIGYCLRWKNQLSERISGDLTVAELKEAELTIIKMKNSQLKKLNPFLDEKGLIRVGGKLCNALIEIEHKHPYLLPNDHYITHLIMRETHEKLLHCGTEQLIFTVRMQYWPISARKEAKSVVKKCLICFKFKPKQAELLMGNLPIDRLLASERPFTITGIDYAGPIQVRECKRRRGMWQTRGSKEEADIVANRKNEIRNLFKTKMGLLVDIPKSGFGNTNDGKTSRRLFNNPKLAAKITGVNENLKFCFKNMSVQEAKEECSHPTEVSYNSEREKNIKHISDFEDSGSEYKPSSDSEDSDSISHSSLK
ncbi:uncharacterized protein [Onthophagus taurus]|uniref:uncharacterized protein n=1 Tax=Onthophagus taurus TaxID=166361 RepID=UPI0039BDCAFA